MKRFAFRLQKLLDIRVRRETILKEELAKLLYFQKLEEEKLIKIERKLSNAQETKGSLQQQERTNPNEIEQYQFFIDSLVFKRINQLYVLDQAKRRVTLKREELIEASKEKKIIEKLREKKEYAYYLELDQLEQKTMDEIATYMDFRDNPAQIKLRKMIHVSNDSKSSSLSDTRSFPDSNS